MQVLLPLELQKGGFKKEQLALLSTALLPVSMTAQVSAHANTLPLLPPLLTSLATAPPNIPCYCPS